MLIMWGGARLTDHIVAVLILHHELQRTGAITVHSSQLGDDGLSLFIRTELNALLNHVGSKLVL